MDAELDRLIDQAQRLPAAQRLQLIAALSERMARGAGIEQADRDFWRVKSLDEHLVEQGITEPQALARIHASDAWPEDDDLEEFLRDLEAQRQPSTRE